jgi:hypothetical protein
MVLTLVVVRVLVYEEVLEMLSEGKGGLSFFLSHLSYLHLNQDIIFPKVE